MKTKGFMKKNFKKAITLVMAAALVISSVTVSAETTTTNISTKTSTTKVNVPEGRVYITSKQYSLVPGATETVLTTNNASGTDQKIGFIMKFDADALKDGSIKAVATYKDYEYDGVNFGMQTVTDQAKAYEKKNDGKVIAGINASFYNLNTGEPTGAFVMNGQICKKANGQSYLAILKDGSVVIRASKDLSDVQEAICGDMQIVTDGEVTVTEGDYQTLQYSRCAVGITADGDIITYTTHGVSAPTSCGETYVDVAKNLIAAGCVQAINVDGGGSATSVSLREGEDALTVKNSPSDGTPRTVSTALLFVSTKASDGVFDHAALAPNNEYYTPTTKEGVLGLQKNETTVQFTATGIDASGTACDLPEGLTWAVAEASKDMGKIDATTGLFTAAAGALGEVTINLMSGTEIVGTTNIVLAEPDEISFSGTGVSLDFSEQTDLGLTVKGGGVVLNHKAGDFTWSMDNEKLGTITDNILTAAPKQDTSIEGNVTVTYEKADGTVLTESIFVEVGKMPIVAMDFEEVDTNLRGKDVVASWDWGADASNFNDGSPSQLYEFENYEVLYRLYSSTKSLTYEVYETTQPWTEAEDGTIKVTYEGKEYTASKADTYGVHGGIWVNFTDENGDAYYWRGYTEPVTWAGNWGNNGADASVVLGADGYYMYAWHNKANLTPVSSGTYKGIGSQIVDASEGEVRFGDYALKLTYDFENFNPTGSSKNTSIYYRLTDPIVSSGSPTGFGMWFYSPEEMDNFWLWGTVTYWNGTTWKDATVHYRPSGADKTCQYTGVNWTGWTYVEMDLTGLPAVVDAEHPIMIGSGRAPIQITYIPGGSSDGEGHSIVMGSKTTGHFYVDNMRWVYGTNVDDMDNPEIVATKANETALSAEETVTIATNDIAFTVDFVDPQGENYSGIDTTATQLFLDGSPLSASDFTATADKAQTNVMKLANGEHALLVSICDNFGNRTEKTYNFVVENPDSDIPAVLIEREAKAELGGDYTITIKTDDIAHIDTVTTNIKYSNIAKLETSTELGNGFFDDYGRLLTQGADGLYYDPDGNVVEEPLRGPGAFYISSAVQKLGDNLTGKVRNKATQTTRTFTATAEVKDDVTADNTLLTFTLPIPSDMKDGDKIPYSVTVTYTTKDGTAYTVTTGDVNVAVYPYYTVEPGIQVSGAEAGVLNITTVDGKEVTADTVVVYDGTTVVPGTFSGNVFTTDYFVGKDAGYKTSNVVIADATNKHYSYATTVTVAEAATAKDEILHYDVALHATSNDSTTTEEITWISAYAAGTDVVAQYVTKDAYDATAEGADPFAEAKSVAGTSELRHFATEGKAARVNAVEITGLTAGTTYVYRVGDGTNWSEVGEFSTMDADGTTKFMVMADVQLGSAMTEEHKAYFEGIGNATKDIDFGLQTGDFTDNPDSYVEWDNVLQTWSDVFAGKDFVRVIGNHEIYGTGAGNSLAILGMDADQPHYYSVEYGDIYVAVINQTADLNDAAVWLIEDAAKTDCTWKVLACHQPIYYSNTGGSNDGHHKVLKVACDTAGIDFTFSGHDHSYVRTEQQKAGVALDHATDETTNAYVDADGNFVATQGDGTVYYICGDLGEKSREVDYKITNNPAFNFAVASQEYNALYLTVEADENKITVNTWDLDDKGVTTLFDTFTMYTAAGICAHEGEHVITQDEALYNEATGNLVCERCGIELDPKEAAYTGFATSVNGKDSYGDSQYYFFAGTVKAGFFPVGEDIWYANADGLIDHKTENALTNTCTENGNRTAYSPRYNKTYVGGKVPFTGHFYEEQEDGSLVCSVCKHKAIDIADWEFSLSYTTTNYNGAYKTPAVNIVNPATGEKLVFATDGMGKLTDFTRVWSNNKNVGTATVIVEANPESDYTNSKGQVVLTLKINPPVPTGLTATADDQTTATLTWNAATQATGYKVYKLVDGKWRLIETTSEPTATITGLDCATTYEFAVKSIAEIEDVTYTSIGYSDTVKVTTTDGVDISKANVTLNWTKTTYNGNVKAPVPKVTLDGKTLVRDTDYTVARVDNVNAGTAKVIVKGTGMYTGETTVTFTIAPQSLAKATAVGAEVPYAGEGTETMVTVTDQNGIVLTLDKDYTVEFANNDAAGKATFTVTGKGNYTGTVKGTYTITGADITKLTAVVDENADLTYTGKELTPTVTVGNLVEGKDYTVAYSNNINVGTATVTVTGKGGFAGGKIEATFQIVPAELPTASLEYTSIIFAGEACTPAVTVAGLTLDKDYTVAYADNAAVGTATVTVTGKGNYTGTQTLTFSIVEEEDTDVYRIFGKDRCKTSIGVADEIKAELGIDAFETIILATGDKFADALSGNYLAYVKNAPIILITEKSASVAVDYINANLEENGKVYILGGDAAVKESWIEGIKTSDIVRLSGKTRYDTNIAILTEAGVKSGEVLVATGEKYADSLSAAAAKLPIFLVKGDALTEAQTTFLGTLENDSYCIVGGDAAVTVKMEAALTTFGKVDRVKGKDRYLTSVAVAEKFVEDSETAVIVYGEDFPDGLCGGLLASVMDGSIILASDAKSEAADKYIDANGFESGYVLGGDKCFKDATIATLFNIKESEIISKRTND